MKLKLSHTHYSNYTLSSLVSTDPARPRCCTLFNPVLLEKEPWSPPPGIPEPDYKLSYIPVAIPVGAEPRRSGVSLLEVEGVRNAIIDLRLCNHSKTSCAVELITANKIVAFIFCVC